MALSSRRSHWPVRDRWAGGCALSEGAPADESQRAMYFARRHVPFAIAAVLSGCRRWDSVFADAGTYDAFHTPEDIEIKGYTGDAMEPFLTRDGQHLLFNNRNEPPENTNLHWAARGDDRTFFYLGEIPGVNTEALEGVPSMDNQGNLYFVSTRSYKENFSTIYRAHFEDGVTNAVGLVEGISRRQPGWVNFDAEISADGNRLYFADGYFGSSNQPQKAFVYMAVRTGNTFQRSKGGERIFDNVNDGWLSYAPCLASDELELFVTRVKRMEATAQPGIFRCIRKSLDDHFSAPQRVSAIQGFAEAATLSPDGRSLYYHARVDGRFRIRRVAR